MQLTYSLEISLFFNVISEHTDALVSVWHEFKNRALAFAAIHEQLFSVPRNCAVNDDPSVASFLWAAKATYGKQSIPDNEEMETAVREWLRMQEPDFYSDRILKLWPR